LIGVHYSTVNPYDRLMYERNKLEGFVLGGEGCGKIMKVGEDVDPFLVGKNVSFLGGGWSRYTVKEAPFLLVFDDSFNLKNGANAYVNPLTACAMLDFAQKHGAKAIIILAVSSSIAKQLIRLCQKEGMETINIVRKEDQIAYLKENYGAKYVLNQESPSFHQDI